MSFKNSPFQEESVDATGLIRPQTPTASFDLSDHLPVPIQRNRKTESRGRMFVFDEDADMLPEVEVGDQGGGYVASDPEVMMSRFDEPIFYTLTEASEDEYIDDVELYIVKKRSNKLKKPRISRRKHLQNNEPSPRRAQSQTVSLPESRQGTPCAMEQNSISFTSTIPHLPPSADAEILAHCDSPKGADPIKPSFTPVANMDNVTNTYVNDEPDRS